MRRRQSQIRVDTHARRVKIERVREWVYKEGKSLRSQWIDKLLGPESLVPTRVRSYIFTSYGRIAHVHP
jgi:hypothetical protein